MTAASTEAPIPFRPALRLLAAPVSCPPYDDEPGPAPVLRLVTNPAPVAVVDLDADAWLSAERTPTAELPAVHGVAGALVRGVLEVLAGVRGIAQLRRDTTAELYADLVPALTGARDTRGSRPDARAIRSLHVQERPEGVAEVCATVVRGGRFSTLALRLEGLDGRWRCTELVGI
jgi:hypothetical protein